MGISPVPSEKLIDHVYLERNYSEIFKPLFILIYDICPIIFIYVSIIIKQNLLVWLLLKLWTVADTEKYRE